MSSLKDNKHLHPFTLTKKQYILLRSHKLKALPILQGFFCQQKKQNI